MQASPVASKHVCIHGPRKKAETMAQTQKDSTYQRNIGTAHLQHCIVTHTTTTKPGESPPPPPPPHAHTLLLRRCVCVWGGGGCKEQSPHSQTLDTFMVQLSESSFAYPGHFHRCQNRRSCAYNLSGGTSDRRKIAWVQNFPRVKLG